MHLKTPNDETYNRPHKLKIQFQRFTLQNINEIQFNRNFFDFQPNIKSKLEIPLRTYKQLKSHSILSQQITQLIQNLAIGRKKGKISRHIHLGKKNKEK